MTPPRPFLATGHVRALLAGLDGMDGSILALPVADTVKREAGDTIITASRDGLWRAQTPQAFPHRAAQGGLCGVERGSGADATTRGDRGGRRGAYASCRATPC